MERSPDVRPSGKDIATYYNATSRRRVNDYTYGNARVSKAVGLASSLITRKTTKILDVGCGIGSSAATFAAKRDWLTVHAIDISPESIETSKKLFGKKNIVFEVDDMKVPPRMAPYDLITMLDVYEHIPRTEWPLFHEILGASLAPEGTLVLTTPSQFHQAYLAAHCPEQLQIIDETVHIEDLVKLAASLNATIVKFDLVSVWRTNDYCHCVIVREPRYDHVSSDPSAAWLRTCERFKSRISLEFRRRHVRSRLGV